VLRPLIFFFAAALCARAVAPISIEVDLSAQKASLLQDGQIVYQTPISSGRRGYATPCGDFQVIEKDENHLSSLYGVIMDASGRILEPNADRDMRVPKGARFVQAPMKHFLRFDGATGLHAGYLPGYPASHGCVRLPPEKAALFFHIAEVGTPVRVFGQAPGTAPRPKKPVPIAQSPVPATPAPKPAPAPTRPAPLFRR
jgi:lipoprotein-anchoring transpeptidase ErfK/SrfK